MACTLFINKFATNITEGINYIHSHIKQIFSLISFAKLQMHKQNILFITSTPFIISAITPIILTLSEIRMSLTFGA
jgi:hypothetical protein